MERQKKKQQRLLSKCLKDVGLSEKLYQKSPFELSGGQKRRVAIAGILAMEPEYFILDEPTAGLDPVGKDQILKSVKRKLHEEKEKSRSFWYHTVWKMLQTMHNV